MDISSLALWWSGSWSHLVLSSWLLENQKIIMKYWAPEGVHTHCVAKDEGMFVSRVIRKRGECKTSGFPLVFQKDGLIWQLKPHSHQWATREGRQQLHVVTSCRCCRKSDRGHFHHAITTSKLQSALLQYQELRVADSGKTSSSLLLSFWSLGWAHGDFYFFLRDINTFHFYRHINFSVHSFQQPSRHLSSVPSSTITLADKKQWVRERVARDTWFRQVKSRLLLICHFVRS